MDYFKLARDIRTLDMGAALYDLRELGYEPVRIEAPDGKAQYAAEQRAFSTPGQSLRPAHRRLGPRPAGPVTLTARPVLASTRRSRPSCHLTREPSGAEARVGAAIPW